MLRDVLIPLELNWVRIGLHQRLFEDWLWNSIWIQRALILNLLILLAGVVQRPKDILIKRKRRPPIDRSLILRVTIVLTIYCLINKRFMIVGSGGNLTWTAIVEVNV